jgi:hypothetical protein
MRSGFFHSLFVHLLAALLAAVPVSGVAGTAPDAATYRLTDAGLGKYEKATDAMYAFIVAHPEAVRALDGMGDSDDEDVTAMARWIDQRVPGLRVAMERSGMSLEEYYTFSIVMAANVLAVGMAEHFGGMDESRLGAVERANMAFIKKNGERMQRFSEAMTSKYESLMGSDDEDEYDDEYDDDEE